MLDLISVNNFGGWTLLEHLLLQCAIDSYDEHWGVDFTIVFCGFICLSTVYLRKAMTTFKSELRYPFLFSGFTVQYWFIISPIVEGGVPVIIISFFSFSFILYMPPMSDEPLALLLVVSV